MKIKVNIEHCIASGACVLECPKVFQQDELGQVVLLQEEPPEELHESVRRAVAACPTAVFEIEED